MLPAAWEYANYAMPLRTALPRLFEHVHAYRSREPLFRVVQEGSVVLIARGYLGTVRDTRTALRYRDHESAQDLIATLRGAAPNQSPISSARVSQITSTVSTAGAIQQAPFDPVITGASSGLSTAKESPTPVKVGDVCSYSPGWCHRRCQFLLALRETTCQASVASVHMSPCGLTCSSSLSRKH